MNVAVIGTGYVGAVTGICFAEMGNQVTCIDINQDKVKSLSRGNLTIYEPNLDLLLKRNLNEGRITFSSKLIDAVKADIIFLALPTPPSEDGSADLAHVLQVAEQLSEKLKHYTIIVNKSTVPVGTAEKVQEIISQKAKVEFDVVSNPEFLREGFAVQDFMKPDRIVIGTRSKKAAEKMSILYEPFTQHNCPILVMDERSAEMTKYAANAFLATKISFMNEIANLCELSGADVDSVRLGVGADERIGNRFLFPGLGYGGSCFPKDVLALHHTASTHDYSFSILNAVMEVNQQQSERFTNKVINYFSDKLSDRKIAVWGLAFKPDTDDIREAPSLKIINKLLEEHASIKVFDPKAASNVKALYGNAIVYSSDMYTCLENCDALIIATEWAEFRQADLNRVKQKLKMAVIFDGRNLYDPLEMQKRGFTYISVGRS